MLDTMFSREALLFTVPALAGAAVFVIKMGLMALGGFADIDADADVDVDVDLGDAVESGDSTEAFNLLSIQSIAAFFMGFGWGGLGGLIGLDWSFAGSLALGGLMLLLDTDVCPIFCWALVVAGIAGTAMISCERRCGWLLLFGLQPLWVSYAVATGQHGLILGSLAYGIAQLNGFLRSTTA